MEFGQTNTALRVTKVGRARFSALSEAWRTPREIYDALNNEFHFTMDPCPLRDPAKAGLPLFGTDGLSQSWFGQRVFVNPPYGHTVGPWLEKAREADVAVYLLPARTDTAWWHDHALKADDIRFVRGRLRFEGHPKRHNGSGTAPFPSVVLVYKGKPSCPNTVFHLNVDEGIETGICGNCGYPVKR